MRLSPLAVWLCALFCLAAQPALCKGADMAAADAAEPVAPTAGELNLDRYLAIYEDLGAALANVDNATDADLVAVRVAADFLLLRGMDHAISRSDTSSSLSPEFLRSFQTRREQVRSSVDDSIRRLREANCYGSTALPAALTLFCHIAGTAPSKEEAEVALQELLSRNLEMMLFLLEKAVDAKSAAVVASLMESACQCKAALVAYGEELGAAELPPDQLSFFVERRMKASAAILLLKNKLEAVDFHGCEALRRSVEAVLTL